MTGCMICLIAATALGDDTMLIFVGENLEMLTIASRREEAAWVAPAIADVISRTDIEQQGAQTISQALADTPGVYMNHTEKGTTTYLRGIKNSALYLFDTVPMGSAVRKSDTMTDYETSLASVKRIEIIRGAGSVLWGPDAFAGVINVVPLSGKDFQGLETGFTTLFSDDGKGGEAYLNYGVSGRRWSSFFSVSGRKIWSSDAAFDGVRFWGDDTGHAMNEDLSRQNDPSDDACLQFYGSATYRDWLTVSVRISDHTNAFTVSDPTLPYHWEEQADIRTHHFKVEASKRLSSDAGFRFTGYYSDMRKAHLIPDKPLKQSETSWYGELIYDHSFLDSKGLLTLGASWRRDRFDDVVHWLSYYPYAFASGYLTDATFSDYDNNLTSVFGQYRHGFDTLDVWIGARYDSHDEYDDETSFNTGFSWKFGNFILKSIYGTGYRTPFAGQWTQQIEALERIENVNVGLSWKQDRTQAGITAFRNKIENHVVEDSYPGGGRTSPNSQTIDGVELELSHQFTPDFKLQANITLLNNKGNDETYWWHDYDFIKDPDTNQVIPHYDELTYAYDAGPNAMGNIRGVWQMTTGIFLVPELKYISARNRTYIVSKGTNFNPSNVEYTTQSCKAAWVADLNLLVTDVFPFDLSLYLNNIFDNGYVSSGVYSDAHRAGFSAGVMIKKTW